MSDDNKRFPGRSEIVTMRETGNNATIQASQRKAWGNRDFGRLTFSSDDTTCSLPVLDYLRFGSSVIFELFIHTAVSTNKIRKITIA